MTESEQRLLDAKDDEIEKLEDKIEELERKLHAAAEENDMLWRLVKVLRKGEW